MLSLYAAPVVAALTAGPNAAAAANAPTSTVCPSAGSHSLASASLTRAIFIRRAQSIADVCGVITASVVLSVAFFSALAFLNNVTQKSVDSLKADVDRQFQNVDRQFQNVDSKLQNVDSTVTLASVVSVLTLALVVYVAVAAPSPTR
jgi:hypothetical protein